MNPASISGSADRFECVLGFAAPRDQDLHDQRLARGATPGLQRVELLPLPIANRLIVIRSIPDEHFDERAGQPARKRLGRPRERERARLLRGRADVDARSQRVGEHGGRVLLVDQQRAGFAHGSRAVPRQQEPVVGQPLHLADARAWNRPRVATFLPLPPMVGGKHVDAFVVQHAETLSADRLTAEHAEIRREERLCLCVLCALGGYNCFSYHRAQPAKIFTVAECAGRRCPEARQHVLFDDDPVRRSASTRSASSTLRERHHAVARARRKCLGARPCGSPTLPARACRARSGSQSLKCTCQMRSRYLRDGIDRIAAGVREVPGIEAEAQHVRIRPRHQRLDFLRRLDVAGAVMVEDGPDAGRVADGCRHAPGMRREPRPTAQR